MYKVNNIKTRNLTSESDNAVSVPGIIGKPASKADWRADTLSPILAMTPEEGPINIIPLASHAAAKSDFSDRKP